MEFLKNQLKEVIQNGWPYIKDSNDLIKKIKHVKNIPDKALLETADVVGLYHSILPKAGLRDLKEVLERREEKKTTTVDFVKMAEIVLKKNYLKRRNCHAQKMPRSFNDLQNVFSARHLVFHH